MSAANDQSPNEDTALRTERAREFLCQVFASPITEGEGRSRRLVLHCKQNKRAYWFESPTEAARAAVEHSKRGVDVYVHCALHDYDLRLAAHSCRCRQRWTPPPRDEGRSREGR